MKLVRNINSTYVEVKRNLKILEQEGVLTDQHVGRLRMIKLNQESPKTGILLEALKILNTQTKTPNNTPKPPYLNNTRFSQHMK